MSRPSAPTSWSCRRTSSTGRTSAPSGASNRAPERVETGTLPFEAIAGATAAVDFLASVADGEDQTTGSTRRSRLEAAYRWIHERGETLFRRLWEGLDDVDGVTLYGPPPGARRAPTLGFAIDGVTPRDAAGRLADRAVFVSHGDFYATSVIDRLGVREAGGLLRAGIVAYTTAAEIDRLVEGVKELAAG